MSLSGHLIDCAIASIPGLVVGIVVGIFRLGRLVSTIQRLQTVVDSLPCNHTGECVDAVRRKLRAIQ